MMIHHSSNKSRGFGFVIYKDKESVDRVLKIPFHSIMNRKVYGIDLEWILVGGSQSRYS